MASRVVSVVRSVAKLAVIVLLVAQSHAAVAQGRSCSQISGTLSSLERNGDFRHLQDNIDRARTLQSRLRDAESLFVRGGCQRVVNSGQRLSGDCRALANEILGGRDDYNQLSASIQTGQAVAQQREAVLQQMARFGCDGRSSARFNEQPRRGRTPFQDFLDRVFGDEGRIIDDPYGSPYRQSTIRTVCVRMCDGYYWPISFATVEDYLGNDAAMCQQQCPGEDVELYFYHNPGENPEQMVSVNGQSYTSLPNAFRYRKEYDASCGCKTPKTYGSIEYSSATDGRARASISIGDLTFPLPMRDPRRTIQPKVVQAIQVPLPRPRPPLEGDPTPVSVASATDSSPDPASRVVTSGDRRVRIVGPDTPYARSMAKGL